MKRIYVKPEMAVENIELESMIALSAFDTQAKTDGSMEGKGRGYEEVDFESTTTWGDLW
jgi:hypothetical protein